MKCAKVQEILYDFMTQRLDKKSSKKVKEHLMVCRHCQAEQEELKETFFLLDQWQVPEASPGIKERVWKKIEEGASPNASPIKRVWDCLVYTPYRIPLGAAAAILLLFLGAVVYRSLLPGPYEQVSRQLGLSKGGSFIESKKAGKSTLIESEDIEDAYPSFPARRALLVGIQDYDALPGFSKSGICDLKGPINDVATIKRELCTHYGFTEEDIKCLLDKEATRGAIEESFREWLTEGTRPGDIVVFYFSGHGSQVRDYNQDEADHFDEVLLPVDMDPETGDYVIIDDEIGAWLSGLYGRTVVVIIDSCYSGGAVRSIEDEKVPLENTPAILSRFIPLKGYKPTAAAKAPSYPPDVPEGIIFLNASKEDEAALEVRLEEGFYGGFTYALCHAMARLKAPTYRELFDHARKVVKDELCLTQEPGILAPKGIISQVAFKYTLTQVLVLLDPIKGATPEEMKALRNLILKEPFIRIVDQGSFFDRLVQVEKNEAYQVKLINRIGDVERIGPGKTPEEIAYRIIKRLEYAYMAKQLAHIDNPNPPFKITLQVTDEKRRDFFLGEDMVFRVQSEKDCYILLINVDTEGAFHIIFPNQYHQDNFIKASTPVFIPDEDMLKNGFQFQFIPPPGEETIKLIATTKPLDLNSLGLSEFRGRFTSIRGIKREGFLERIKELLFSDGSEWSGDTVVVRSYEKKQ